MENNNFLYMVENYNKELLSVELGLTTAIGEYYSEALVFGKRKNDDRDGLWTSIKKFFAKLIAGFQEFNRKVVTEVQYRVQRIVAKFSLSSTYKKAVQSRKEGFKSVEVHNVAKMVNIYNKTIAEITPIMNRISKVDYKTLDEMDNEINLFEKKVDDTYRMIGILEESKIKIDITDYIHFLEREISGNSDVFKSLSLCERELKLMESEALRLKTKREILGPDIITKKVSIMKKVSMGITNMIKTILTKLIMFINVF